MNQQVTEIEQNMRTSGRQMKSRGLVRTWRVGVLVCPILMIALAASLLVGCSRDPKVKRQKYLESGQRYFEAGKYQEASIQFSNAIEVDKGFADAHFRLGETLLKLGSPSNAYAELRKTVELQPDNYKARLLLASLLIAGRNADAAAEQAEAVLQAQPNNAEAHQTQIHYLGVPGET